MTRPRVLVTRRVFPAALDLLRPHVEVDYHSEGEGCGREVLARAAAEFDAVVCQLTDRIDAAVLGAGTRLRLVANVAVGVDNIDLDAARRLGIQVTNTPGVLTESTADLAFALLLATARRLGEAERFLRAGQWRSWEVDLLAGRDVHGATLGIVGPGRIGQAVARRAGGFGMRVIYHGRRRLDAGVEQGLAMEWRERLHDLLSEADFVSLHVPHTAATEGLIGAAEFLCMPPHAVLVNTARGAVVDESALLDALRERRIGGAGLDVFAAEPEFDRRFAELDNAVLLPHIGSATVATREEMCCMAARNVLALVRGDPLPNPVR